MPEKSVQVLECYGGPWDGQPYEMPDGQDYVVFPIAPKMQKGWKQPKHREAFYRRDGKRLKWIERDLP